jgi:hypothetical protein
MASPFALAAPTPQVSARPWEGPAAIEAESSRAARVDRELSTNYRIQWHPAMHEDWGGEQLYFWRCEFPRGYTLDGTVARTVIDEVFRHHGVRSYVAYELFGDHDLSIRAWLPRSRLVVVERDLKEKLYLLQGGIERFWVSQVLRHWWWDDEGKRPGPPSLKKPDLRALPARRELEQVDELVHAYNEGEIGFETLREHPHVDALLDGRVIRRRSLGRGIKFMTVVSLADEFEDPHRDEVRTATARSFDRMGEIEDRSMYEGNGFADFMYMGRVPPERWESIRHGPIDALVDQLWVTTPRTAHVTDLEVVLQTFRDRLPRQPLHR